MKKTPHLKQTEIPTLSDAVAVPGHEHTYVIRQRAAVGTTCRIVCPECHTAGSVSPSKEGKTTCRCTGCRSLIIFKAERAVGKNEEKVTDAVSPDDILGGAELTWGNLLLKKRFALRPGTYLIGRTDDREPSDVSLDDKYASRRSLQIEVVTAAEGRLYRLTVNKAKNPVLLNGRELREHDAVFLNYGDIIKIGTTLLKFKKTKQ